MGTTRSALCLLALWGCAGRCSAFQKPVGSKHVVNPRLSNGPSAAWRASGWPRSTKLEAKPTEMLGEPGVRTSPLGTPLERSRRAPLLLTFWALFAVYAFVLSPGGDAASQAAEQQLLSTMVANPFDGSVEPIFVFLFNSLGLLPAINLALLMPGSKDQSPLPTLPFVAASFALGFFALGPYLAVREFRSQVLRSDIGGFTKLLESKANAALVFVSSVGLMGYLVVNAAPNLPAHLAAFGELFRTSRLAHISSLDFLVLSILNYGSISEDMRRRRVGEVINGDERSFFSAKKALLFSAIPVVGPAAYLLARPPLPED